MNGDCGKLNEQQIAKLNHMQMSARSAVSDKIGAPVPQINRLKQEAIDLQKRIVSLEGETDSEAKKIVKQLKKELKFLAKKTIPQEPKRYEQHKKFYDEIVEWVLKLSAQTSFAVPPTDYLTILDSMVRRQFGTPFANLNNTGHTNSIVSMRKKLKFWKSKIGKITPGKNNQNIFNKSFQDIWRMVATKDASGLGFKVTEYAARLPDATWNTSYIYLDRFEEAISKSRNNIDNFTDPGALENALFSDEDVYRVTREGPTKFKAFSELPKERQKEIVYDKYEELIRDLMDGKVRYVVPMLIPYGKKDDGYADWATTKDGQAVLRYVHKWSEPHRFHHVMGRDGVRYTYVMVQQEEGDVGGEKFHAYLVSAARRQFDESGAPLKGRNEWSEFRYYVPIAKHFKKNPKKIAGYNDVELSRANLEEGFYDSNAHRPFNYPMRNQNGKPIKGTNLTSYHGFKRMEKQPNDSIMNEGSNDKTAISLWERIAIERSILSDVYDMAETNVMQHGDKLNDWARKVKEHARTIWGMSDESAQNIVDEIMTSGQYINNLWKGKGGKLYTGNMFMSKVKRLYDPRRFLKTTAWDFMDKAVIDLRKEIADIGVDINTARQIVEERVKEYQDGLPFTHTDDEFLEATKREKSLHEARVKAAGELKNIEMLRGMDRPNTPEEIKQFTIATQAYHLKTRRSFTNALKREKDNGVVTEYVNSTSRALHFTMLKMQLLEALTHIESPEMAQFLINRVKISTGMLDYDTNFMGMDVSNRRVAASLNRVAKAMGKKGEFKPSDIHWYGVATNSFISSNLLGMWGALNNNTQRLSFFEEYGYRLWRKAAQDMNEPQFADSNLMKAVRRTGTLDPLTAFGDLLTGSENNTPAWWTHRIKPNLAITELKMAKRNFLGLKYSIFDKMLTQTMFSKQQIKKIQALKKYNKKIDDRKVLIKARGKFYDALATMDEKIFKNRIKELNRDLTRDEINKLVSWKLRGMFPIFGLKTDNPLFTFQGGEKDMRIQATIVGFHIADEMDLLDTEDEGGIPKFEQQAAVDAGRMVVYNLMFGMSLQHLPDGFGGIFKTLLQYKPYQFHEFEREYKLMENFFRGNERKFHSIRRLTSSFFKQFNVKGMKGDLYGDKNVDEMAGKAVRFLETRAMATILTVGSFWSPFLMGGASVIHHVVGDKNVPGIGQRVTRAYESPMISIAMKILMTLGWAAGFFSPTRRKKMDEWWEQLAYTVLPPLLSWLIMLPDFRRAFKPVIPLYDEVVDPAIEAMEYDYSSF